MQEHGFQFFNADGETLLDLSGKVASLGEAIGYLETVDGHGAPVDVVCRLGRIVADYGQMIHQVVQDNYGDLDQVMAGNNQKRRLRAVA